ncbi:hypothetical protein [Brevibacillus daliensis]|uniref:hypothetical protein n=1 Tax=Brevibacillus daliensis TaxID=2892995 RepID=UPI001E29965F|nr:hypothetical protein [Brevibacillus daliensis]
MKQLHAFASGRYIIVVLLRKGEYYIMSEPMTNMVGFVLVAILLFGMMIFYIKKWK